MYDSGEILAKHLAQLALDLVLNKILNNGDGVKGAVYIHGLEWVCFEYERYTLLFGDYENDV